MLRKLCQKSGSHKNEKKNNLDSDIFGKIYGMDIKITCQICEKER